MAYLSELGATNEAALGGAGKGTPMLKIVEELEETKKEARSVLDELARRSAWRAVDSLFRRFAVEVLVVGLRLGAGIL